MSGIRIHLELAEEENLRRHAEALGVDTEDIAYAALQRYLLELKAHPQETDREILNTRAARSTHLPLWNDSGRSMHPFEDAGNDYAVPGL